MTTRKTAAFVPVGGVDYPRNWHEFLAFFSTERDCLRYLERVRWPDGFRCPACGHDHYWLRGDGRYLCCACRHKTSVTAGTLFDGSRIGLASWFAATWYVVNQNSGVSALGLQRVLGLGSYQTAWALLQKLRRAMVPTSGKLRGNVEVDESYVGGHEQGVGGRETYKKSIIAIAVERHGEEPNLTSGRVRIARIPNAGKDALMDFIRANVEPGSTIVSDAWGPYANSLKFGYKHRAFNISKSGKQAHEVLPCCHRVAALLKRWLLGTHQGSVQPSHLDYYLAEFTFRYNRRYSTHRGQLFRRLVEQAVTTGPQPYRELLSGTIKTPCDKAAERAVHKTRRRRRHARPGGPRTRLNDGAHRRRYSHVAGRRGGGGVDGR